MIECIISSLESEWIEERITAVRLLLKCIQEDGKCRNVIADKAELSPVLEILVGTNDQDRFEIVQFLSELVKLNRYLSSQFCYYRYGNLDPFTFICQIGELNNILQVCF